MGKKTEALLWIPTAKGSILNDDTNRRIKSFRGKGREDFTYSVVFCYRLCFVGTQTLFCIKLDRCIEGVSGLTALETFNKCSFSVHQKVCQLFICQFLFNNRTSYIRKTVL